MNFSELSHKVIGCAIQVHKKLGPGLLESVYERCLCYELQKSGIEFRSQVALPITYDDQKFENGYRIDVCVEGRLIVELKAVDSICPLHEAQIMTYLRLSGMQEGLLINFNVLRLVEGVKWYSIDKNLMSIPAERPSCSSCSSGEVFP